MKVVTIDGPAGSGKSTLARMLAERLGWTYITTGALYRAFGLLMAESGGSHADRETVRRFISILETRFLQDSKTGHVFLDDRDVTLDIRSPEASRIASVIAEDSFVRQELLPLQRRLVLGCGGAVVDGRDMGTVVFPEAPLKFFLTASAEQRAKRRILELSSHGKVFDLSQIEQEIHLRDARDSGRQVAPLKAAADAIVVDSTHLDLQGVIQILVSHCVERGLSVKG